LTIPIASHDLFLLRRIALEPTQEKLLLKHLGIRVTIQMAQDILDGLEELKEKCTAPRDIKELDNTIQDIMNQLKYQGVNISIE
jgi:hypothetical protein